MPRRKGQGVQLQRIADVGFRSSGRTGRLMSGRWLGSPGQVKRMARMQSSWRQGETPGQVPSGRRLAAPPSRFDALSPASSQGPEAGSFTTKSPICIQYKTAFDAKTNDVDEPVKPLRAVEMLENAEAMEGADVPDFPDTSYLHKKFKKVAGLYAAEPKTDPKPLNGYADVPKSDEDVSLQHTGRYICPYCQLACAKPSVLQKHVRAHTNERPFPCAPCGFAFKTKSNLYKHCRSQSHRVKMGESCDSGGSDVSEDSSQSSPETDETKPANEQPRIYKPKFHKAAFFNADHESKMDVDDKPNNRMPSASSELLQQRISKIIRDNQVIFETMEPQFSKKFLQRQNSRERETNSPKCDLDVRRIHETKSKLALALLKVDRMERSHSPSYPKVNSENHTYQPLNLTKKPIHVSGGSMIKEILIASRDAEKPERMAEILNTLDTDLEVGPLLGNTPLVDAPGAKKRRVQSTTVPPDPRGLDHRRLSTSSLPSTLKSLEELSRHPMKLQPQPQINMFGGEVQIFDRCEPRSPEPVEENRVVMVAKPGLHASGGTLVSTSTPAFHMARILSPDTSNLANIAPNVVTPNLGVPGVPPPELPDVLTIMHGERQIPFVPGMPGPQSLSAEAPRRRDAKINLSSLPSPSPFTCSTAVQKVCSSSQLNVPNDVPKIEISLPAEERPRKFLRPTSLPLKPGSFTPKRLHQGITPTVLSLVSPETPRPKKSYGQLFLNGHAYTYLGMKCSTRPYYCTISRPQPMYVVQSPQRPRLSMYSNWKVHSELDSIGLTPGQAMALYDSRYRTGGFTTAESKGFNSSGIITHSSAWKKPTESLNSDVSFEPESKKTKICNGGFESTDDYTYIRGRGRGRYVCDECGIRCRKPSMLKKHIRTHSNLRPYCCRHCAFAFKTKGNLTKHLKSKAHFKRCSELGVDPTPPHSDGESDRDEESNSSETESYDTDDEDSNGADALEREAACSLLSLSSLPRVQCVAAGLLPRSVCNVKPACYPYTTAQLKNAEVQTDVQRPYRDEETPIDLSQKDKNDSLSFLSKDSEFFRMSKPLEATEPKIMPIVPLYLAATQPESPVVEPPNGLMLQAYLTAKALRDVQMKQQQRSKSPETDSGLAPGSDTVRFVVSTGEQTPHDLPEPRILVVGDDGPKRIVVSIPSQPDTLPDQRVAGALSKTHDANLKAEFFPPASGPNHSYVSVTEDGRSICVICNKTFSKPSQLRLHVNIHYFERPFRCEICAVSFRTKGHLQKHERSVSHHNKVSMNTTFGAATTTNPRPFKCDDCKIAFRIHGHLAKHLRSKMHIMKLECIGKLPFGTYAELERSGFNLNEIDTTDCDNSLESLQALAQKLYEKDSSKFGQPPGDRKVVDEVADSDGSSSDGLPAEHFQCRICGNPYESSATLQVHMFADHNCVMVLDKRKSED